MFEVPLQDILGQYGFKTLPGPVTFLIVVVLLSFVTYWKALPKPIPGIPYNKSAMGILGDVPEISAHVAKTKGMFDWIVAQNEKHQSPIVQIFSRPLGKPWVVITDAVESQKILKYRARDFDRSFFFGEILSEILPKFHSHMASLDPQYKENRKLVKDLMATSFLNEAIGPQINRAVSSLIGLWSEKMEIAQGRPFEAKGDIYNGVLDAIFASAFGLEVVDSSTQAQRIILAEKGKHVRLPLEKDHPVVFPIAEDPPAMAAILQLTDLPKQSLTTPLPSLYMWFALKTPHGRSVHQKKEAFIQNQISSSVARLHQEAETVSRSALDDLVKREYESSQKEGREPNFHRREIYDEMFGFIIGGHDNTATTLSWAVKLLADHPETQNKLRSALHQGYPEACNNNNNNNNYYYYRDPTIQEMTSASIPYLDAVVEEIARTALTVPMILRRTLKDVDILGYRVPAGHDVVMMANGPGFFSPAFPSSSSPSSSTSDDKSIDSNSNYNYNNTNASSSSSWDPSELHLFKPERWLVPSSSSSSFSNEKQGQQQEEENLIFNPTAGPHLAFGLGPRACFGKRLAYLQLRIALIRLVWRFELLRCRHGDGGGGGLNLNLSSYDAVQELTRAPQQCYVRLGPAPAPAPSSPSSLV